MNFTPLFKPDSMAVAGVSLSNDRHPANVIYHKIHLRYPVKVYPVNPKGGVFKRDRVYRTMEEIPGPVDLAAIAVRADLVPETLAQCIRKGVGGAVIISGGFAECGRADLQERITAMAREADFPFIGPNCLGIYSPGKFATFFLPGERLVRPNPGSVGFVSQSGGVLVDQMVKFAEQGLGLSLAVSIGNKALIRETDLLRYLAEDPATTVIAFYVEEQSRFIMRVTVADGNIFVYFNGKPSPENLSKVKSVPGRTWASDLPGTPWRVPVKSARALVDQFPEAAAVSEITELLMVEPDPEPEPARLVQPDVKIRMQAINATTKVKNKDGETFTIGINAGDLLVTFPNAATRSKYVEALKGAIPYTDRRWLSEFEDRPWRVSRTYAIELVDLFPGANVTPEVAELVKQMTARRWLRLFGLSFQPAELAKLAAVLFLASYFARRQDRLDSFLDGFLPPLVMTGVMAGLIILQPNFGTAVILLLPRP